MDFYYYKLLSGGFFYIEKLSFVYIDLLKKYIFNGNLEREFCVVKVKLYFRFN